MFNKDGAKIFSEMHESVGFWDDREGKIRVETWVLNNVYRGGMRF
jgi:hypothetical protein